MSAPGERPKEAPEAPARRAVRHQLDGSERDALVRRLVAGEDMASLAREYGLARSTIIRWLRQRGLVRTRSLRPASGPPASRPHPVRGGPSMEPPITARWGVAIGEAAPWHLYIGRTPMAEPAAICGAPVPQLTQWSYPPDGRPLCRACVDELCRRALAADRPRRAGPS